MSPNDAPPATGRSPQRNCIIVLGMHRSGTSALARTLGLLGLGLPRTLIGGDRWNAMGYGESSPVGMLNDRMLSSARSRWADWRAIDPAWHGSAKAAMFRREAAAMLRSEFEGHASFVLKDPRICRLVRFWVDVLADMDVRPMFVLPVRNPLEVAASLHRRDGFEPWFSLLVWQRHVLEAEHATRGMPRAFVSYGDLLADWRRLAGHIGGALDLNWPRPPAEVADEVDALLSDKHRHHRARPGEALPAPIGLLHAILARWSRDGERAEDFVALDRIGKEFDEASALFSGYAELAESAADEADPLPADLVEAKDQLRILQGDLAEVSAHLAETTGYLAEAKRQFSESEAHLAGRDSDIAVLRDEIERLKARRFVLRWRR